MQTEENDGIDRAVRMAEPQREREEFRIGHAAENVQVEGDDVVRLPADDERDDESDEQTGHPSGNDPLPSCALALTGTVEKATDLYVTIAGGNAG